MEMITTNSWLKAIRLENEMTQQEAADRVSISQSAYCNIERGIRIPGIETAKRIGSLFGFDWVRLFEDEES